MNKNILTVIVPAYNEEKNINHFYCKVAPILNYSNIKYEIVFIDDGSSDDTWQQIMKLSKKVNNVKGIKFSKNFGKESAIYAGLTMAAESSCCVVIDCDLQHPPEKIVEMYKLWQDGYEIIEGVKRSRGKENFFNKAGAKLFYNIMSKATNIDMKKASDFKFLDSKAIVALLNCKEKNAFFRALSSWIGFKTACVEFEVEERLYGDSKWSVTALAKYAVKNITSFSAMPMQIVTILGIVMLGVALVFSLISIIQKFMSISADGFTTVIILSLFSNSIIMISLGIIGYYIEQIYEEEKKRPRFIISEMCGVENEKTF